MPQLTHMRDEVAATAAARRLRAALVAVLVNVDEAPELALVHRWLDSWRGVGLLAVGLHRVGYDRHLTQYGDGHWRATFYVTGSSGRGMGDGIIPASPGH